jgi:hypothetical protein
LVHYAGSRRRNYSQKSIEPEIGAAAGHVHTMENGIKSLKIYTDPKVHLLEK